MPPETLPADILPPAIPLARWAGRQLAALARLTAAPAIAGLCGSGLLGERAALGGLAIPHRQSAGGGCHLLETRDGWIALNLARPDDRDLLPALFEVEAGAAALAPLALAPLASRASASALVARGREMGMAVAALEEAASPPPAIASMTQGPVSSGPLRSGPVLRGSGRPLLVVDLAALWAGPLAAHLFWLAGADVIKVESRSRPDAMRTGDPAFFALLNQGKASVSIDLRLDPDRAALIALIERADIVIEAARPRALRQLGIDADDLVRRCPGLVWLTITGHGAIGPAADWVGFGDDCGVAGGLSAALARATGAIGFVGDAIADPLTGIAAALAGWQLHLKGAAARVGIAMSGVAAQALAEETALDRQEFERELRAWAGNAGKPMARAQRRAVTAPVRPLGADGQQWLRAAPTC